MVVSNYRSFSQRAFYRCCWTLCMFVCLVLFRLKVKGRERLPKDRGPFLLLSNHTSALDPVWVGVWLVRPANFMASEALFRVPILGPLITAVGAFPKQKFVRDNQSVETLQRLYDGGGAIVMFPEGTRTWDGRMSPVRGGIGSLIKKLNARVVFVKNKTGHLVQPRWAPYPRFVPVEIEYSEPYEFPAHMDADDIAEVVREQILVDPNVRARRPAFGFRLAVGLPSYLWACPSCFAVSALRVPEEDRDRVSCMACETGWRVTLDSRLVDARGEEQTVGEAFDKIAARFGNPPVLDKAAFDDRGVVLEAPARLSRLERGRRKPTPIAVGRLELSREELRLLGPQREVLWRVGLTEVRAVSVEVGNQLRLLPPDEVLVVEPHGQSTLLWSHALRGWIHHAKGGTGEPPPG